MRSSFLAFVRLHALRWANSDRLYMYIHPQLTKAQAFRYSVRPDHGHSYSVRPDHGAYGAFELVPIIAGFQLEW